VTFPASRAAREDSFVADTEQGIELAFDPDVDHVTSPRAAKMQAFHRSLLLVAADRSSSLLNPARAWRWHDFGAQEATIGHL
jgi:hypothetical protein